MTRRYHRLLVLCLVLAADLDVGGSSSSIASVPMGTMSGPSQTENGYDRLFGTDAVCWASSNSRAAGNDDVNDGIVRPENQQVQLLRQCPSGNGLEAKPPEGVQRFRIGTWYNYYAELSLNLTSLGSLLLSGSDNITTAAADARFGSDRHVNATIGLTSAKPRIAVSVIACEMGLALCTPFVAQEYQAAAAMNSSITAEHHVRQSPLVFVELSPEEGPLFSRHLDIPMLVDTPGDYFVIVNVQLYLDGVPSADQSNSITTRIDMANALLHQRHSQHHPLNIYYQEPPVVLDGSVAVRYGSYVAIAIGAAIILWLLVQLITFRSTRIMQITQGRFLAVFLIAGFIATVASFLLEPLSDIYCQWGLPIVISSLQLFFAITVGRVWRIHAIVSPAIMKVASRGDKLEQHHWIERLLFEPLRKSTSHLVRMENRSRPTSLHKSITDAQLAMVVAIFTIPQIILQLLAALLQPRQLRIDWNDDESMGRQYCAIGNDVPGYASLFYYGLALFALLLVILNIMARATRDLPSLFNESKDLFDAVVSSLVLVILGLAVSFGTDSPTTTPTVDYVICVVVVLCATLQASLRLMLPKLKMAWNNEQVVVSELVCEHSRSMRQKQLRQSMRLGNKSKRRGTVSGLFRSSSSSAPTDPNRSGENNCPGVSGLDFQPQRDKISNSGSADAPTTTGDDGTPGTRRSSDNAGTLFDEEPVFSTMDAFITNRQQTPTKVQLLNDIEPKQAEKNKTNRVRNRRQMVLSTHKPPDWRLVLKMMDLENHLQMVNKKVLSGRPVEEEEWEVTRKMTSRLGSIFVDHLVFEWEKKHGSSETSTDIEDSGENSGEHAESDDLAYYSDEADDDVQAKEEVMGHSCVVNGMDESMNASLNQSGNSRLNRKLHRRTPREKLLDFGCCVGVRELLGVGPARFAPDSSERSLREQAMSLSKEESDSLRLIRSDWKNEQKKKKQRQMLTDEMVLRFLRHNPGRDAECQHLATWRAMKNFDLRYMSFKAAKMEEQLLSKTLFPVPGLKSLEGSREMFYMRPCRFDPGVTPTSLIIDNLVYCMSTMLEKESACTNGIGFVACMDEWTMKNFSTDYCFQFMQGLQGKITPVNVMLFLIVNPPPWFGKVWSMMKPMLSADFQKKVKMISERELPQYLAPGYEKFLPDDMCTGEANTDEMVRDWVAYRKFLEQDDGVLSNSNCTCDDLDTSV